MGYRRFRCRTCKREFNERTGTSFNHLQYPTDVVCLVVLWRIRYKLSLRDLPEMFLERGIVLTHEAVREWEAQLALVRLQPENAARWSRLLELRNARARVDGREVGDAKPSIETRARLNDGSGRSGCPQRWRVSRRTS